jgi:glutamate-1-semialdehyde 2,1-aminomutase
MSESAFIAGIARSVLERTHERERHNFVQEHPRCVAAATHSLEHWLNGVPMHWMTDWALPVPLLVSAATGAFLDDVDGHRYSDFCLGDTGAMFGHSPPAIARVVAAQAQRGLTCMLPAPDTVRAGELLAARFGLPFWQMTQTATDANRAVIRWARALTGRDKILIFDGCYHGSLEDTLVHLHAGQVVARPGQVGRVADFATYTRVVEFNDPASLARELAAGDVACVLAEPVMTNAGMVLPVPGFWDTVRALCDRHEVLLAIDETHTLSSGPGGHARKLGLRADFLVAGKAIAGGVPCAVFGFSAALAERMSRFLRTKPAGHSGMGTTLAANLLATAALVACLDEVMTEAAYLHMDALASELAAGLTELIEQHALSWSVTRVGARVELCFSARAPRTARESLQASAPLLEQTLHLYLLNRGVLVTPFHNMMLVSPATTAAQVASLLDACANALQELRSGP